MKKYLVISFACLLFLTGCNTATIYNVYGRSLTSYNDNHNMDVVADVIMRAAIGRDWEVKRVATDKIRATLYNRQHVATVAITFDQRKFNIEYVSSQNLKHVGTRIHRNYNRWVHNLENDIRKQMQFIKMES